MIGGWKLYHGYFGKEKITSMWQNNIDNTSMEGSAEELRASP